MKLWIIATVAAYYIKGLCGFANTLVFTSVLSFREFNAAISPVDLLLGYPMNVILVWKSRKSLDPKIYVPLAMLVLMGSIPSAFLLKNVDVGAIKLIFGLVVIAFGTGMLLQEDNKKGALFSKKVLAMIGVLAGVVCGLFGVGAFSSIFINNLLQTFCDFIQGLIPGNLHPLLLAPLAHILEGIQDPVRMVAVILPEEGFFTNGSGAVQRMKGL